MFIGSKTYSIKSFRNNLDNNFKSKVKSKTELHYDYSKDTWFIQEVALCSEPEQLSKSKLKSVVKDVESSIKHGFCTLSEEGAQKIRELIENDFPLGDSILDDFCKEGRNEIERRIQDEVTRRFNMLYETDYTNDVNNAANIKIDQLIEAGEIISRREVSKKIVYSLIAFSIAIIVFKALLVIKASY